MTTETGSTYTSESMIDIDKILMEKVGFRLQRSKKLFKGHIINHREPEIADKTGSTNITQITTHD